MQGLGVVKPFPHCHPPLHFIFHYSNPQLHLTSSAICIAIAVLPLPFYLYHNGKTAMIAVLPLRIASFPFPFCNCCVCLCRIAIAVLPPPLLFCHCHSCRWHYRFTIADLPFAIVIFNAHVAIVIAILPFLDRLLSNWQKHDNNYCSQVKEALTRNVDTESCQELISHIQNMNISWYAMISCSSALSVRYKICIFHENFICNIVYVQCSGCQCSTH